MTHRVLFDESHSQAWTLRPDVAAAIQPAHPADSSYAAAADLLRSRGCTVRTGLGPLTDLAEADVLVLAHPSDARWERVVPGGSPLLTPSELDAIEQWVADGGGLVVLGECEQDKHGNNLNALLQRFGAAVVNDLVSDYDHHHAGSPHWVLGDLSDGVVDGVDLLARVSQICFYRAGSLDLPSTATALARASATSSAPGAPLLGVLRHGAGRVVVAADSDLFGDDCLGDLDHAALWTDLVAWAALGHLAAEPTPVVSALTSHPAWPVLRDAVDELRALQEPDGSVTGSPSALVGVISRAVSELAAVVPHQADYCAMVVADLAAWVDDGFARPHFDSSLAAFRPDLVRQDGIEHLVVLPLWTQNGSPDTRFEALAIRTPWPGWLADLERSRFDNPAFVPITLTDGTRGYDSECAVLFPETVAVAGDTPNHFGGILCDRESARFRRTVSAACRVTSLALPAEAAALLASADQAQDAFALWDLVHDRAHSHGDLPFDPFMIRQRAPYWMYALEELRCDLTAFAAAGELDVPAARQVQHAVLLDRMLRFPLAGARVRNYDGLAGQLLFAYLHQTGRLHYRDNRLSISWTTVQDGVLELKGLVDDLYRVAIDRSKLAHWAAAHELVSRFVAPAAGSVWAQRDLAETGDLRPHLDAVLPDEFPLSMFYVSLASRQARMAA
jgi:hypothetical protein